ncbi:hypothetical protein J5N97_008164 [Dioscorea zingiberensis]|uniref:Uncharacterized protein n=1 Tax=Dioscorea zingiberensis TaxID=325984 RepID=A0A9D5HVH3_9LILI|nr:hypothetical protein J5N97_008164 [Dioscorea zingiberensis]
MEKSDHGRMSLVFLIVILLGSAAFSCCIAAEFKKAKAKEMKVDGNLCAMAQSPAFGLGITALVCLSITQVVGTSLAAMRIWSRNNKSAAAAAAAAGKMNCKMVAITLLILSWLSFGLAAVLVGASSSMNRRQGYGKGWLDGKCYVVKDGVYIGAGVLVLATTVCVLGLMRVSRRRSVVVHHLQRAGPGGGGGGPHVHNEDKVGA